MFLGPRGALGVPRKAAYSIPPEAKVEWKNPYNQVEIDVQEARFCVPQLKSKN